MKSLFLSKMLLWVIILRSKNIIMILMICSLSEIGNGIKIKKTNTFVSLRKGVCYKIADTFSITAKKHLKITWFMNCAKDKIKM